MNSDLGLLVFAGVFVVGGTYVVMTLLDEHSWFWELADPDPPGGNNTNQD
ncbi:MAG: hypothetical protein AAB447_03585 [Patescibacteria group bacterium]